MAGSRTLKLSILADVDNLKKNLDSGSKEVEGFGGKLEKFGKVAATAFAAAGAAALAYAGKLAVDGVKAAIEDEAAQKRLANALTNVTGATEKQIAAVEEQILQTSLATGVADDQLRPALQRLATATGDLESSQDLLNLSLDISAATGKSVEAVSNALGKAYEGNTSALGRLGIGLSATEIKTLGLEGTVSKLADTFGGSAAVQAQTFEGQIKRLQVGFDEAKESVGAALLPILQKLMDYFVNTLIPKFQEAKKNAVDPIIKAFKDNEDTLRSLWDFIKNYLVPIFENTLVNAIVAVGKTIAGIVNVVSFIVREIKKLVNEAIDAINTVLTKYNSIAFLPNVGLIRPISTSPTSSPNTVNPASLPQGVVTTSPSTTVTAPKPQNLVVTPSVTTPTVPTTPAAAPVTATPIVPSGNAIPSTFDISRVRRGEEEQPPIIVNVNAPSIIDEEGFARALSLAMNNAQNRTGAGASQFIGL